MRDTNTVTEHTLEEDPTVEFNAWRSVALAAEVWRCLWRREVERLDPGEAPLQVSELCRVVRSRPELDWVRDVDMNELLADCREAGLLVDSANPCGVTCSGSLREWLEKLYGASLVAKDLLYIAAANVRERNGLSSGAEHIRLFQDFAAVIRDCFRTRPGESLPAKLVLDALDSEVSAADQAGERELRGAAFCLIEAAMIFGSLRTAGDPRRLELCGSGLDSDFLFHSLFGLHTSIAGFDELFEGGLLLAENFAADKHKAEPGGRVIVVRGRFGTGKSTLALLIGAEVARKGGFVWYYSIEESVRQRCRALESMMANEGRELFLIRDLPSEVSELLEERKKTRKANPHWRTGQGAFAFYTASAVTYDSLLKPLDVACCILVDYEEPLTLMVVDPLNAVLRSTDDEPVKTSRARLRANTVEILTAARKSGVNVLLVCEEETEAEKDIQFMENIADTVIHLTVESHKDCRQRFLEISKSRYQKETGGKHAFNIEQGPSVRVFPSSASFAVRYGRRDASFLRPTDDSFGLKGLDQVFGAEAVFRRGDAFAVVGPSESLRRILAFKFLLSGLGANEVSGMSSETDLVLLLTTRDDECSIRDALDQLQRSNTSELPASLDERVRVCVLPRGYVQPGYVFQRLQAEFEEAARNGQTIRRVVVDDVAYLELTCPFIRGDEAFGTALLGLLAQHEATALFVCDDPADGRIGHLQTSFVDGAQTVIQLRAYEDRGVTRNGLRVTRTRTMQQGHGVYELVFGEDGLRVVTESVCSSAKGATTPS